jgi:hypothetical protein
VKRTGAKLTRPTKHLQRTTQFTRSSGWQQNSNKNIYVHIKHNETPRSKVPNGNLSSRKYISKKLQQLKGCKIKGNKTRGMPQQTAPQFLSSATTKGVGERSPKSRPGTRRRARTLEDTMPALLSSLAAKCRTLDGPPGLRSHRCNHDLDDD